MMMQPAWGCAAEWLCIQPLCKMARGFSSVFMAGLPKNGTGFLGEGAAGIGVEGIKKRLQRGAFVSGQEGLGTGRGGQFCRAENAADAFLGVFVCAADFLALRAEKVAYDCWFHIVFLCDFGIVKEIVAPVVFSDRILQYLGVVGVARYFDINALPVKIS